MNSTNLRSKNEQQRRDGAHKHAGRDDAERHVHLLHRQEPVDGDTDEGHDHYVVDADADLLRVVQRLDSHFTRFPRKEDAENEEQRYKSYDIPN